MDQPPCEPPRHDEFQKLFNSEQFSDVKLRGVGAHHTRFIFGHKAILTAGSPAFATLMNQLPEKGWCHDGGLTNVDVREANDFKATCKYFSERNDPFVPALRYIYGLPILDETEKKRADYEFAQVWRNIHRVATAFEMPKLAEHARDSLEAARDSMLNSDTVRIPRGREDILEFIKAVL